MNEPETTTNPYSAPQTTQHADLAEVTKTDLKSMLFSFQGRIPRRAYWGNSIASGIIFVIIGVAAMSALGQESIAAMAIIGIAYIALIWISIALGVKRWHDLGKSGWWYCIALIPLVGGIWTFVECGCLRGTIGNNQYGADPT